VGIQNKWAKENPEEWKEYYHNWYIKHKKKHLENVTRWQKMHPQAMSRYRKNSYLNMSEEQKKKRNKKSTARQNMRYRTDSAFRERARERSKLYQRKIYEIEKKQPNPFNYLGINKVYAKLR